MPESVPESSRAPSSSSVTVVRRSMRDGEERTFHLIGTAHVSRKSVAEVEDAIARVRPDTVCVELCPLRYAALTDEERWRALDVATIVRNGEAGFTLATLALQSFQKRLGDRLGVRPGAELLAATVAAKQVGAAVVLADRDVGITLRRTWANLGPVQRLLVVVGILASASSSEAIDEQQVEALKERERISDLMGQLAKVMPEVKVPLIDERDRYLVSRIEESPGSTVVAVVGAGHVEGMLASFGQPTDRAALEALPRPTLGRRAVPWAMTLACAAALVVVATLVGTPGRVLFGWACATGGASAVLISVMRGSLPSVLAGALAAPILGFVPGALGPFVGRIEGAVRPAGPEDGARLGKEVISMRSALGNRVTRTLLVAVAAGLGGTVGRGLGLLWLAWVWLRALTG